jgi:putative ABC transport system ATP-binding protein
VSAAPAAGRALLRRSMAAQRRRVVAASALLVTYQAGEALVPVLVGVIIDRAVETGQVADLIGWLAVLAAVFAVLSVSWRFGMRIGTVAAVHADRSLRLEVARRVLDVRGSAGPSLPPGATVSIATADVRRTAMVNFQLPHGIAAAVGVVVASIALLALSVPLGLLIMLGTPVLLVVVRIISIPLENRSSAQQEQAARAAGVATDLVRGIRVLKGIGAERAGTVRYRRISQESLGATLGAARAEAGYSAAVIAVNGAFLALVALVGGRLAAAGSITVGQLVSAVALAQFLLGPLSAFGDVVAAMAGGRASAARIAGLLDAPRAVPDGDDDPPVNPAGRIDLQDVHGPGLDGLTLHVEAGESVAVLTTDPVAAATLRRYLAREADPESGRILLDDIPLDTLSPAGLHRAVLVCPQAPDLFSGTVQGNVVGSTGLDSPAAGPALERVLAAARVDQVAQTLPAGMATAVTERGRSLSGGQRQRVALARALLRDPVVLVLHDPTSAVDSATEAAIAAELRRLRADRSTIVITTSPAFLARADRVVMVVDGRAVAVGEHAELMRRETRYRTAVTA